ncbi:SpdD protein [Streptomyces litchfieldiae]|uniref:SpdD protein n=1 Tax=Streptomyces litchfieldiae TaxID=3075543 RepID=A0ABU2N2G1_9ACTN|nr:SpdD protein [Streptomyces sp. DSM 44938]MDT0347489.1 SpdD protein [Streptomyces sp. DSM 44938]
MHHHNPTPHYLDHLTVPGLGDPHVSHLPAPVLSGQVCGCTHDPAPVPAGQRPQIHISTGGVLVVVIGGVFLTITIGVVLTSLLLAVAIVAGSLALVAVAMAMVAMSLKSMANDSAKPDRRKRRP